MEIQKIENVAVITGKEALVTDVQSALDIMFNAKYETGCERIAIEKSALCEAFFVLRSGLAGEVLQKFINYHMKLAIFGDFSHYTSKPLRDFIYESNNGRDIFFTATREEAVERLSKA